MKKILSQLILVAFGFSATAQTLDLNKPLPVDSSIIKGVLKNGMTYYLCGTDVTKDVASYYIIQNVGSILENDNQQGLAHFLEHMAFNGTENFPEKDILNTLEKEGIVFGRDINAYTSFDETVYNINNLPTTHKLINTGLQILHDWSNYLLLTKEEIDAERGVIKEEWRTRQNGQMRILKQSLATKFNHSKYEKRMPIGLMSVVDHFEYKALRDFYHNWYRTDLQAIAIVGDFDVAEMEKRIISKFSKIPAIKNPLKRTVVHVPDNNQLLFKMAMDEEVATSGISFSIRHDKSMENETVANLKEGLLNAMINTMLSARITELAQDPSAAFIGARIGYQDSWVRTHKEFTINVAPKPDQQQAAFKAVLKALSRAVKFGFTSAEINRTKVQFTSSYEDQIERIEDLSHATIIKTIQSNYLENVTMTDLVKEYELVKVIFNELKAEEIHTRLQDMYSQKNRYMLITGVANRNNMTKEEAQEIISDVENDTSIKAYADNSEGKSLMDGVNLTTGKITSSQVNDAIGATIFVLSNGIKVHYKFVNKNKNVVNLQGVSHGGKSLLKVVDYPSNDFLEGFINMSGLGAFSSTDLPKILAGKNASTSVSIGETTESISGSSSTKDVETMLQLVNLRFTHPRFDATAYDILMQNLDNYLIKKAADLRSKMQDSMITTLYGTNNPKKRIITKQYLEEVSFVRMKEIYKDRFANAADFEFFIVGDVNQENLIPLLEKYIASIPTNNIKEAWKNTKAHWVNNNTDKDIFLKMENPKASVRFAIKNTMKHFLKDALLMRALGDILRLRFTESLREEEGGTYGASSLGQLSKRPIEEAYLSVSFDCNPDKAEDLVKIAKDEIQFIKNGTIKQTDLEKTLSSYLKLRKEQKNYNGYEMSLLKNYELEGYNMNDPENFENIINSITIKDIQDITKRLLKDSKSYEIIFKPKVN